MKFKTSDLIANIDARIADLHEAARTSHENALQQHADSRAAWFTEYAEEYLVFANRIKEKLRKGRPILYSDIPEKLNYRLPTFRAGSAPKFKPADVKQLETLKAALMAVADEYVTTSGLREIGFRDIASLFGRN